MRLNKTIVNPDILKMYQNIIADVLKMGLEFKGILDSNNIYCVTGYRACGQCLTRRKQVYIALNPEYVKNCLRNNRPDLVKNTLIHEICHALKNAVNHGPQWKAYARLLGNYYGLEITRTANEEEAQFLPRPNTTGAEYKYKVYCPECGAKWLYKTRCKIINAPYRYQCGKCKIGLKSEKL